MVWTCIALSCMVNPKKIATLAFLTTFLIIGINVIWQEVCIDQNAHRISLWISQGADQTHFITYLPSWNDVILLYVSHWLTSLPTYCSPMIATLVSAVTYRTSSPSYVLRSRMCKSTGESFLLPLWPSLCGNAAHIQVHPTPLQQLIHHLYHVPSCVHKGVGALLHHAGHAAQCRDLDPAHFRHWHMRLQMSCLLSRCLLQEAHARGRCWHHSN